MNGDTTAPQNFPHPTTGIPSASLAAMRSLPVPPITITIQQVKNGWVIQREGGATMPTIERSAIAKNLLELTNTINDLLTPQEASQGQG